MAVFSCLLPLFLLFILSPLPKLSAQQNQGSVSVGQSLKASPNGPTWLSPSGHFAFGFHAVNDQFLLSIWYAKIPDTIVWYANDGNLVSQGSTVTLTSDQGLLLNDPKGSFLWSTHGDLKPAVIVTHASINDTGNLVLRDGGDVGPIWQSFEHPTDTLLPTQTMEQGTSLYARRSQTNFTQGKFKLIMQKDGNLVFYPRDLPSKFSSYRAYDATATNDNNNQSNSGLRVVYEESGNMYLLRKNGLRVGLTPDGAVLSSDDYYYRATLNFDGVLTWNYHPKSFDEKTNVNWETLKTMPDNICSSFPEESVSGTCGLNNICILGNDRRPKCECPSNFSLVDPDDMYGDCKPDFKLHDCNNHGQDDSKYSLIKLENTDWEFCDYAKLVPSTQDDCQSFCLNDCFCSVAVYSSSLSTCWKKKLPLLNGKQGKDVDRILWIKVGNDNSSQNYLNPINMTAKNKLNTVVTALLACSAFVNFCILSIVASLIYYIYQMKQSANHSRGDHYALGEYGNVTCFSYKALTEATKGFKEEIGRGAFAIVYKGVTKLLLGQSIFVAVKKLDRISKDADKEFKSEVNAIGQTHHKNLVRLIGFCKEEDKRLLVYEYMSKGSLAEYLFGDVKPNWFQRIQVARGTARGLLYLHEECGTQIIHCDIKPQNILLDDNYNARISDFGLAKLLVLNQTQTYTAIRGTKGYVAPEWFRNKAITAKVDVYSFGVVLLEIICCRRNVCLEGMREEETILTDWAFNCYQFGTLDSLVNNDIDAVNDKTQVEQFVMVALWCIQEDPSVRPTMRMVSHMLEGLVQVPQPPSPTSFSLQL